MAQRPDGKPAATERVVFTRPAAERISKVVRTVEAGDRRSNGLSFGVQAEAMPLSLKVATFTGSWATGTYKTVTLVGSTNTASVYNWCNPAAGSAESQYVVFGKAGGTNSVVEIQLHGTANTCLPTIGGLDLTTLAGYSAGEIQILGHSASNCLRWYSITTCATA